MVITDKSLSVEVCTILEICFLEVLMKSTTFLIPLSFEGTKVILSKAPLLPEYVTV